MPRKEVVGALGVSLVALERWLKRRREGEDLGRGAPRGAGDASWSPSRSAVPCGRRLKKTTMRPSSATASCGRGVGEGADLGMWLQAAFPDELLARLQPHRGSLSKTKNSLRKAKARTLAVLFEAAHRALSAVTVEDTRGFFCHCGYGAPRAQSI